MSPSLFQTLLRSGPQRVRRRVHARVERHLQPKPWVERVLKTLPDSITEALREALGVDADLEALRAGLGEVFREKRALNDRLAALDAARADLDKAWAALREAQLNLRGREAKLDARAEEISAAEATLTRLRAEAGRERLIPTRQIINALPARPRSALGMQALVGHMRRFGQQTPVVVRAREDGRFELISGRRRMEALTRLHATHARARIVEVTDAEAAALYLAENYLTLGISAQALKRDAEALKAREALRGPLQETLAEQATQVDALKLGELVEEARYHLTEGASWLLSLRAHWAQLEPEERARLEGLLDYFTRLSAFLKAQKRT